MISTLTEKYPMQTIGLILLVVGFLFAVGMSYKMFHDLDSRLFGDLGFVLSGISLQIVGIGCLILAKKN